MNKKILFISLIVLLICISFATIVIGSDIPAPNGWVYDGVFCDASREAYNAKNVNATFFTFDLNPWINGSRNVMTNLGYTGYGSYCIENTDGVAMSTIASIIDLFPTGEIEVYNGTTKFSYNDTSNPEKYKRGLPIVKAMAYAAEKSLGNNESNEYDVDWKLTLQQVISNHSTEILETGLGVNTAYFGDIPLCNDYADINNLRAEAEREGPNKAYRARFLFINAPGGQNQIIFCAVEGEAFGKLEIEKKDKDTNNTLKNVGFKIQNESTKEWVADSQGQKATYTTDENQAKEFRTDDSGKISVQNLKPGTYVAKETSSPGYGYAVTATGKVEVKAGQTGTISLTNEKQTGNLRISKVDTDRNTALTGVQFKVKAPNGKYLVAFDDSGKKLSVTGNVILTNVEYADNKNNATTFTTSSNGSIGIFNVPTGTYTVEEISVGNNKYYEIDNNYISWTTSNGTTGSGNTAQINIARQSSSNTSSASGSATTLTVKNRRKYIDISGTVWEDIMPGKTTDRNNLYDTTDKKLQNVTVRLIDWDGKNENVVSTKTTDGNGNYKFEKVNIDNLNRYYIEFEYNGMSYQNVVENPNKENGSKASENQIENWKDYWASGWKTGHESGTRRDAFNDKFTTIENKNSNENSGEALSGSRQETALKYDKKEYRSELNYEGNPVYGYNGQSFPINGVDKKYLIKANTWNVNGFLDNTKSPDDIRKNAIEEITNINLGVYEREQVDLFLTSDIANVTTQIKGYTHVYEYEKRLQHKGEAPDEFYQVGVKFGEKYVDKYTQPIYRSDYMYENGGNGELEAYITYKIVLSNRTKYLTTTINSIVDYYVPEYNIIAIGTEMTNDGTISGNLVYREGSYNNEFKKVDIDTALELKPQEEKTVYIKFQLTREKIADILKDLPEGAEGRNLNNIAEITSYSTRKDDKVYGMIDKNSNPRNAIPGQENTYENDTDKAPDFRLKVAQDRSTEGVVFLDTTDKSLLTNAERKGDGKLETDEDENPTEPTVPGITVRLKEGNNVVHETTTANDGTYKFTDFTPGKYTVEYEWGKNTATDGTETNVYDYKGTIYNNPEREVDEFWYKKDIDTKNSDAKDNYDTRTSIDEPTNTVKYDTESNKDLNKTMVSTTPEMNVKIEYADIDKTDMKDDNAKNLISTYEIKNIDFGIVERPRQQLDLNKIVSKVRVTLANGQTVTETNIDPETGELVGEKLTNKRADPLSNPKNGYVKIEIDEELIQGAKIEVEYAISVRNNSELDYINQEYYHYGTNKTNVLKLEPTKVIDYLDKDIAFDISTNSEWTQLSRTDLSGRVDQTVYMSSNSKVEDKRILHTEHYRGTELAPGESTELSPLGINVSKLLTSKLGNQNFIKGNEAEIIEIVKNGGRTPTKTETPADGIPVTTSTVPGNYVPGNSDNPGTPEEPDDDTSEEITVTPSTGANLNYIIPIATAVVVLVILGTGIYFIKKKVLD